MSKKTLCYSVRLESLTGISDKAYKATCFNGQEDILPKSTVFGFDFEVSISDAYWIAAWVLEKKNIQFSNKKKGWFNPATGKVEQHFDVIIQKHVPTKIEPAKVTADESLTR
jgi:hypothetical protein